MVVSFDVLFPPSVARGIVSYPLVFIQELSLQWKVKFWVLSSLMMEELEESSLLLLSMLWSSSSP